MMVGRGLKNQFLIVVAIGFAAGFIAFLYDTLHEWHLQNGFVRLVMLDLQKAMNLWLLYCFFTVFPLLAVAILKKGKIRNILICTLSFCLFCVIGWGVNHYWLPGKYHPVSILSDIVIFALMLLLAHRLIQSDRERFYDSVQLARMRKCGLVCLCLMIFVNLIVWADRKINIPEGPNVILISIDTLRADHLGCYGYGLETSPYLDSFSENSALFLNVRSHIHCTTPSHLSIFTSLYPSVFNVIDLPEPGRLHNRYITLAEIMRNNGYKTAAFTAGGYVHKRYGFAQGFDVYLDEIKPDNISGIFNTLALRWIKQQRKKFMVFLHCYEPHVPYNPPDKFKKMFSAKSTPTDQLKKEHIWVGSNNEVGQKAWKDFSKSKDINFLNTVIGLYDGEIRNVDSEIERLFRELKESGIFDDCLIIFLSDHGESFYEHGSFGHLNLYDENLRVPLIFHFPRKFDTYNRKKLNNVVGLVDVLPTILDVCNIRYSGSEFQGHSLLKLIDKKDQSYPNKYIFSEGMKKGGWKSISTLNNKYIAFKTPNGVREELYDIKNDPGELHNLLMAKYISSEVNNIYLEMKRALVFQLSKNEANSQFDHSIARSKNVTEMDDETAKRLKSLGYIQ